MNAGGSRTFRPARVAYSASRAERQSRVTRLAVEALGTPDAMLFLNGSDAALGGTPIDLAGDSEQAMSRVEKALTIYRQTSRRIAP